MRRRAKARVRGFFFLLAAGIMGLSCAGKGARVSAAKQAELEKRVKDYHEALSWRDFETASLLVAPESRAEFMARAETLKKGYKLTEYQIISITMNPDNNRAAVIVSRSFVAPGSVTLQYEEVVQEWVEKNGTWLLAGPPY